MWRSHQKPFEFVGTQPPPPRPIFCCLNTAPGLGLKCQRRNRCPDTCRVSAPAGEAAGSGWWYFDEVGNRVFVNHLQLEVEDRFAGARVVVPRYLRAAEAGERCAGARRGEARQHRDGARSRWEGAGGWQNTAHTSAVQLACLAASWQPDKPAGRLACTDDLLCKPCPCGHACSAVCFKSLLSGTQRHPAYGAGPK